MKVTSASSFFGAAIVACALLTAGQIRAQTVQTYEYQPDRIYPVRTGLGITTQIELSPNEKVLDFSTGFSTGWELSRRDNVFYLKPRNVDVDTNMLVRTEMHSYIFELKVVTTDWKTLEQARQSGVQYKVSFDYAAGTKFSDRPEPPAPRLSELSTEVVKGRTYNFSYDYATRNAKTSPWIIPINVYDDGQFTYIKMGDLKRFPTGNFPTVYMRQTSHGEDAVVNTTVEGNIIVVHGTYPYLVIRHGSNVVGLRRNAVQ